MISELHLKYGSSAGQPPFVLEEPSVTIFVGPNNSGKSVALREIVDFCRSGQRNAAAMVVDNVVFEERSRQLAVDELRKLTVAPNLGEAVGVDHTIVKISTERQHVLTDVFIEAIERPNSRTTHFTSWYLRHLTLNLDGPSRIGLVSHQSRGDLKYPTTTLGRLLTDDPKRAALRETVYDALRLYFAIDMSVGDQLHVRFGSTPPPDERSVSEATLEYMRNARDINAVSDGVKAFVGILLELQAGDPRIVTIDEPEAFLHPSLASRLGREIARSARAEQKHIFVATHSPQFLMGAIQSGASVNIVRLTYLNGVATARLLPNSELTLLMRDPLLRSVGVLSALFYDNVVVTEADADRAFYQEINERLLSEGSLRGISNAIFLNAQGKDTIPQIISPLRKLGIPSAVIVDIDVLEQGRSHWTKYLAASNVPPEQHQPLGTQRATVWTNLVQDGKNPKSDGGMELLKGQQKEAAENLLELLREYGLFVVHVGEIERWLGSLDIPRSKHSWLRTIFEKMGSNPASIDYVRPSARDVWDFIGLIRAWLLNPQRKGLPK